MRGKVKILGKAFPAWVIAVALIVASAGAATGVVLAGNVTGAITLTASQSLLVLQNSGTVITGADASLITVDDDETAFQAAAEINTGDTYTIKLSLANDSDAELSGELTLIGPDGITLKADAEGGGDMIDDVVRTGPFTWKFRLASGSNTTSDLAIKVALADNMPPGFYALDGSLKQVSN
ncbi:MAG: hypothetical protein QF878_03910 [SAR202 cluster bacterium]|jgi:hypothetical protein|nr:hypothetical protein [SAR202 cluster bacterium]MDP6715000.1 hypothetical protein [SAR202 cluster bacterium]